VPEKVGDGETILEDGDRIAIADATVRALRGRLSALRVSHSISVLYGAFVWACRVLNNQNGIFRPGQGAHCHDLPWALAFLAVVAATLTLAAWRTAVAPVRFRTAGRCLERFNPPSPRSRRPLRLSYHSLNEPCCHGC
jgi:hypothetical protein